MRYTNFALASLVANAAVVLSLLLLASHQEDVDFGNTRQFISEFLILAAAAQAGLITSIPTAWVAIKSQRHILGIVVSLPFLISVVAAFSIISLNASMVVALSAALYAANQIIGAIFQASSVHNLFLFFQSAPKILFFGCLALLAWHIQLPTVILILACLTSITLAAGLGKVIPYCRMPPAEPGYQLAPEVLGLCKIGFVPAVLTVSTVVAQNFEFILPAAESFADGSVGRLARGMLLYSVVIAGLSFFQSRAISCLVDGRLDVADVARDTFLMILCAVALYGGIYLISRLSSDVRHFFSIGVEPYVLLLPLAKSIVWCISAIPGAILFQIGYRFASLLLGLLPLSLVALILIFSLKLSVLTVAYLSVIVMVVSSVAAWALVLRKHRQQGALKISR